MDVQACLTSAHSAFNRLANVAAVSIGSGLLRTRAIAKILGGSPAQTENSKQH